MRLDAPPHFIDLRIAEEGSHSSDSSDWLVEVKVLIASSSGAGSSWVEADDFWTFSQAAKAVYESLKGEAVLRSASPEEFELRLVPASPRGTVQVHV